jgi:hypothetical protein
MRMSWFVEFVNVSENCSVSLSGMGHGQATDTWQMLGLVRELGSWDIRVSLCRLGLVMEVYCFGNLVYEAADG